MQVLRALLFSLVFYITTTLFLVLGSPLLLCPRRWAMAGLKAHAIVCLWLMRVIVGTRMEVRGRNNLPEGPCLIASKHQSAWDTFALIPIFRDPAIVMKAELGLIPLYGWFCYKFQHVLVRREHGPVALRRMVRVAKSRARDGREVLIFPEGTRRIPGAPPDYKPGVAALYAGLELPCVPVALNSGMYWPRRSLLRRPGTIVVDIMEPIPPGLARAAFMSELERRIEAASARLLTDGDQLAAST